MKKPILILAVLLTMNQFSAQGRILASTVKYEGETIAHFELPEVEITATRSTGLPAVKTAHTIEYRGETIYEIDLPEVTIHAEPVARVESKEFSAIHLPAAIAEPLTGVKTDKKAEVKKPFFHKLANTLYEAGFRLLQTVNEGLFFRS